MSRIGKAPVAIPKGVEVTVKERKIYVKGPKGNLELDINEHTDVAVQDGNVIVTLKPEHSTKGQFHGLMRALVQNLVTGALSGYEKRLEMIGVGYRAAVKGQNLDVSVGFSHPTLVAIPKGIQVEVEKNTSIIIKGNDKQAVGQFAATVRDVRPPEVYQGKGIRYKDEHVRKKQGKAAAK